MLMGLLVLSISIESSIYEERLQEVYDLVSHGHKIENVNDKFRESNRNLLNSSF